MQIYLLLMQISMCTQMVTSEIRDRELNSLKCLDS